MYNSIWYYSLNKPYLSPPDEIFAPVWIFLYITMAISLILFIVNKTDQNKLSGYTYFGLQLIINLLWSPAFFMLQNIRLALIVIISLDIFVILTIQEFYKMNKVSGLILLPYLFWILFATYLNIGYIVLN